MSQLAAPTAGMTGGGGGDGGGKMPTACSGFEGGYGDEDGVTATAAAGRNGFHAAATAVMAAAAMQAPSLASPYRRAVPPLPAANHQVGGGDAAVTATGGTASRRPSQLLPHSSASLSACPSDACYGAQPPLARDPSSRTSLSHSTHTAHGLTHAHSSHTQLHPLSQLLMPQPGEDGPSSSPSFAGTAFASLAVTNFKGITNATASVAAAARVPHTAGLATPQPATRTDVLASFVRPGRAAVPQRGVQMEPPP